MTIDNTAEIERSDTEGVRVVTVAGEVDLANVGAVECAVGELSNGALGVVVDLSEATYIDSSTVGLLFRLRSRLSRRGQELRVICSPDSNAWRVLQLTGFDREVPPLEDRDAAIEEIRRVVPLDGEHTLLG
jgi:stage II sporulation protein AA (anti-sigma F factor antagonist)